MNSLPFKTAVRRVRRWRTPVHIPRRLRMRQIWTKRCRRFDIAARVELNAMTSPQFIKWLKGKLKKHGVKKFVPDDDVLETAFKRAALAHKLNAEIDKVFFKLRTEADKAEVPEDLRTMVQAFLKRNPSESWDFAVAFVTDNFRRAA